MATLDVLRRLAATPRGQFQFPELSHRTTIVGRTGSGKTVAGAWLLSNAQFHIQPFIVLNFKGEELFKKIERARPLDYSDAIPTKPGLYHMDVLGTDPDIIESWLWRVWKQSHVGLFVDETYLMPDIQAFKAILTTGRSRKIPVYALSQRPVRIPRFVLSEADFLLSFHMNDRRDVKTIIESIPPDSEAWEMDGRGGLARLSKFHSRWYDVGQDWSCVLAPVPDADTILEKFERRLTPRQRMI